MQERHFLHGGCSKKGRAVTLKKVLLSAVIGGLIAFTFTGCSDNSLHQNEEQVSEMQNVNVTIGGKLLASANINKNYSVKEYEDYIVAFSGLDSLIIGYLNDDFANGDNEYGAFNESLVVNRTEPSP